MTKPKTKTTATKPAVKPKTAKPKVTSIPKASEFTITLEEYKDLCERVTTAEEAIAKLPTKENYDNIAKGGIGLTQALAVTHKRMVSISKRHYFVTAVVAACLAYGIFSVS